MLSDIDEFNKASLLNTLLNTQHIDEKRNTSDNPFAGWADGAHIIDLEQYIEFWELTGDRVSTTFIKRYLEDPDSKFWVIIKNQYYGFFLTSPHKKSQLLNKGAMKSISSITDITYFESSFNTLVSAIIDALIPYFITQKQFSQYIRDMYFQRFPQISYRSDFVGYTHGAIIDVNGLYHVMLDPIHKTISFYYAENVAWRKYYNSLDELLDDMAKNQEELPSQKKQSVTPISIDYPLTLMTKDTREWGFYDVSLRIAQMRTIVENRVLTVWSDDLANDLIALNGLLCLPAPNETEYKKTIISQKKSFNTPNNSKKIDDPIIAAAYQAVSFNGLRLADYDNTIRANSRVVGRAIKQNSRAIQYASIDCPDLYKYIIRACRRRDCIDYMTKEMFRCPLLLAWLIAARNTLAWIPNKILDCLPFEMFINPEFWRAIMSVINVEYLDHTYAGYKRKRKSVLEMFDWRLYELKRTLTYTYCLPAVQRSKINTYTIDVPITTEQYQALMMWEKEQKQAGGIFDLSDVQEESVEDFQDD